jgi:hypothetical protein
VHSLLNGVAVIARRAAKRRRKLVAGGKVVVHPCALKYLFQGDLEKAVAPVLREIETRFSWQPQDQLALPQRIQKVGEALLTTKEVEYFGKAQPGALAERQQRLIERLLSPAEQEWLGASQQGPVVSRVKEIRTKILPGLVRRPSDEADRRHRWSQLADLYLAQQISCYPPDYLDTMTVDRLLETVERFEEDLTDAARIHGWLKVVIQVGEAIEVAPRRDRRSEVDPLLVRIRGNLQSMLDKLALESPLYKPPQQRSESASTAPPPPGISAACFG